MGYPWENIGFPLAGARIHAMRIAAGSKRVKIAIKKGILCSLAPLGNKRPQTISCSTSNTPQAFIIVYTGAEIYDQRV